VNKLTAFAAGILATGCGLGRIPVAPGTAGSLGALAVAWLLLERLHWQPLHLLLLTAVLLGPGIWAAGYCARTAGAKDPGRVVIDEVLGQWLTVAALPAHSAFWWIAAFALFRLFDIWKPPPVRQAERLPGGIGIVADDLVAALWAALVLHLAGWFNR
jgi:phosphatidylglycerophosphatase A